MVVCTGDALAISAELFLSIAIIMIVARLVGFVFRYFKQPTVLGEVLAGILLGPSALGQIPGDIPGAFFPLDVRLFLSVSAQLGLIIFMFVVGLEVDVPGLLRSSRTALTIGGMSVVLPFCVGTFALGPFLYPKYKVTTCTSSKLSPFWLASLQTSRSSACRWASWLWAAPLSLMQWHGCSLPFASPSSRPPPEATAASSP
mmetsp:Transcript_41321/g.110532  ORF Transcript_41321/g.110532 Transcript_41321/m.110532 type:complete len:201 (-) Transcript_41321:151-753(-)